MSRFSIVFAEHRVKGWNLGGKYPPHDLDSREVGAEQDDAPARVECLGEVLEANQLRNRSKVPVAGPAPQSHFDHRHSQGLEVLTRQFIAFPGRQVGEAEFDIASDDRTALAGNRVREKSDAPSDRKCGPVRQQAEQAQQPHA
jgi:hypothetical protein